MTEKLIREFVREILKEDDYGGMMADISPMGMHYTSRGQLYNTFVKSFTDVGKTVMGKGKELSQRAQTVAKTSFEAIATTLIPFLQDNYKKIFAKEEQQLNRIKQEYGDVYDATWDALKSNDAIMLSFMYSPGPVLAKKFGKELSKGALELLSVISGGTLDDEINKVKSSMSSGKREKPKHDIPYSNVWDEGFVREAGNDPWSMDRGDRAASNKDARDRAEKDQISSYLVKKAVNSPRAKRMQQDASGIVRKSLESVFAQAQAVATAKSLQELQSKMGGKQLPGLDKLKNVTGPEKVRLEQVLLAQIKRMTLQFYAQQLESQAKQVVSSGVPENSQYVKDYVAAIQKIKGLSG